MKSIITYLVLALYFSNSAYADSNDYSRVFAGVMVGSIRCEPLRVREILESGRTFKEKDISRAVNESVRRGCDKVLDLFITTGADLKKIDQEYGLISNSLGYSSFKTKKGTELIVLESLLMAGIPPRSDLETAPHINALNVVRVFPYEGMRYGMSKEDKERQLKAVKLLYHYGMRLDSVTSDGDTLRDIAVKSENEFLYRFLRENISKLAIKKKNLGYEKRFLKKLRKNGLSS